MGAPIQVHSRLQVAPVKNASEARGGKQKALRIFVCTALACFSSIEARALDPSRQISQYAHSAWHIQSGMLGDGLLGATPIAIAQTKDGYLWVGTNIGLMRFDGVRFVPWIPPKGERMLDQRIFSLVAARDGSLWIGTGYSVYHLMEGHLINYVQPRGRIEAMLEDKDGAIWIVRTQVEDGTGPVCETTGGDFHCYNNADGIPFPTAMQVASDTAGNIWMGGYFGLGRWRPGSTATYFKKREVGKGRGIAEMKAIAAGRDGSVWAIIERSGPGLELERFVQGKWTSQLLPNAPVTNTDVTALYVDRENTLWIGTASHGIIRVRGNQVDNLDKLDGLTSNAIGAFYEDVEGTLWVVTSAGIDNLRDVRVASYSMREGLYSAGASSLFAGHDGTVWIGNFKALNYMRDNKFFAIVEGHGLPGRNVTTVFEDHAGRLWVGVDTGLWVYDQGSFHAIRHADGSPLGVIFTIAEDVDHSMWVRAGPNLDHIRDMRVQEEFTSTNISTAYIMAADPHGGVFLGRVNGDLDRFHDGKVETFSASQGEPHQIRDLLVDPDGSVWGTTLDEIVRWKDGERRSLTTRNGLPCWGIFAVVRGENALWFDTQCGIVRIANAELAKWWKHPESTIQVSTIGVLDGVQPGLTSLKPQAVRSPDGRLWFVNGRILQMLDPHRLDENVIPPPVHIEQIIANRSSYPLEDGVRLPPKMRDLEIDYTALSFVVPQKIRYRYKLEGRDREWTDPEARRQAFYSDLPPGRYRFRVIACNNDGVWNETGAAWSFEVEPAYYQTDWFRALCIMLAAFTLWLLYRLRMLRMRERINARFDERIAERTRLARELHDTLLQTIQGSKMVADDALEEGDAAQMEHALKRVSNWLEQATQEGRAALNSLRSSTTQGNDLAEALERAARECSVKRSMEYALAVEGSARELHPIVRDEVYRIGYEAIRNACNHSGGSRLEVDLMYARSLVMRVRDNGKGIHPEVAASGRDGHYGLKGMQERAVRVGGNFTLSSSAYSGTEVELVVPGSIAFAEAGAKPHGLFAKLRGLSRRWKKRRSERS